VNLGSFRILLPFFRTSWDVGVLNSVIFNSFHKRVEFGTILEGFRNFGGRGVEHPNPPQYVTALSLPRVFPSDFPTKTLHAFFISLVRTKRCTQLNLLDLISQVICGIQNNTMSKYSTPLLLALNSM